MDQKFIIGSQNKKEKEHEFECSVCGCYVGKSPKCELCEDLGIAYDEMEAHRATRTL